MQLAAGVSAGGTLAGKYRVERLLGIGDNQALGSRVSSLVVTILAMFVVLVGCGGKTTQAGGLELILESDMPTPATFDTVNVKVQQQVTANGGWGPSLLERDYVIPREMTLPTTIALVAGGSPYQEVLVTVTGLAGEAKSKQPIVQRVLKTQVPSDRVLEVLVVLSSKCLGKVSCPTSGDSCQPDLGTCGPGSPPPLLPFSPSDLADAGVSSTVDDAAGDGAPADSTVSPPSGDAGGEPSVDATLGDSTATIIGEGGADGTAVVEGGGDGAPIDPCAIANGGCASMATCTPTDGGARTCACNQGYEGDGLTCSASAACKTNNGGCSANAKCTGTGPGTRMCACSMGYSGDGLTCTAIDSCKTNNGGCSANAKCTGTGPGTNSCACNSGYTGDGVTCTGIQACATNNGGCAATAKCTSTGANTRTCACNTGYSGDGMTCTPINSCTTNNGGCGTNATCTSTGPGTNTCACNSGYTGDGVTCTAINACRTNNGGCSSNAACTNTGPNTRTCACNNGYSGDGVTCTPINSCLTNNGGCSAHGTCTTTGPGTNSCACNNGYSGDGVTCTPINSCLTNNGGCSAHQTCASTGPGTNSCTCNADMYCTSTANACAGAASYVTCAQDAQLCFYHVQFFMCGNYTSCQGGSCVDVCTAGGNGTEAHCCTNQGCATCEKCTASHACVKEVNEDVKQECTGACKTGVCNGQGACANSADGVSGPGCTGAAITCQSAQFCSSGSCTRSNVAPGISCGTCATCNGMGSCITGANVTCYKDFDNDGYGDPNSPMGPICGSTCPNGYVKDNTDCCDTDSNAYPGAPSWHTNDPSSLDGPRKGCGGWDYDCNGVEEMQYPHIHNNSTMNCTGFEYAWDETAPAPCGSTASDSSTNFGCPCNGFGTMACHFQTQYCR